MPGHSSWGSWENTIPNELFWDACDAMNALFLTNEFPPECKYRVARHPKGQFVVIVWRDTQNEFGLPSLPEEAYPLTDILRDGQAAMAALKQSLPFETDKQATTAGRKVVDA